MYWLINFSDESDGMIWTKIYINYHIMARHNNKIKRGRLDQFLVTYVRQMRVNRCNLSFLLFIKPRDI